MVFHQPPTREDFLPDAARGLVPKPPLHPASMSAWGTLARARDLAKWLVRTGRAERAHVAEILVEDDGPIGYQPDQPPAHHYALWGNADLLARSAAVIETWVSRVKEGARTAERVD